MHKFTLLKLDACDAGGLQNKKEGRTKPHFPLPAPAVPLRNPHFPRFKLYMRSSML